MSTDPIPSGEGEGILDRVLRFSIRQRWLVVAATVAVALLGLRNLQKLPIDAVPDITNVQVQINTVVEGLAPVDVERRITFPIETAMSGLPRLASTRSLSRYGLSQVTVVFEDGTDIYFARQRVAERLAEAKANLPQGVGDPVLGPVATGLGEIFMWTVETKPGARKSDGSPYTAMDLREIQDWIVKPQLRTVPGVTEINSIGGYKKQYHVTPDPVRLIAYGLTFHDVQAALERNNSSTAGGFIAHKGEQYLVQSTGRLQSPREIEQVVVATRSRVPIRVRDVASVSLGSGLRSGAATENGEEVVLGTAFMLIGENSRTVAKGVAKRLAEVNRTLPDGVVAKAVYDRTKLVEATLETVRTNLVEGAALVIAVLFLLLGNFTAALIVALVIPLSMLFAATGMVQGKISANLLSLGAIDFGIIVDGAVVMVENILRRFSERSRESGGVLPLEVRLREAYAAAREVARPTFFGMAIIMIVYLPILTLTGIEGKMFQPMAKVVLLALGGSLLLAFTFVPAMVALVLRRASAHETSFVRRVRAVYRPSLHWALARPAPVLAAAGALLAVSAFIASRLGSEFVPTLDEQDIAIHALRIPGTSVEQAVAMQRDIERTLASFPEVATVFARIGTDEVGTDPMPPNVADVFVIMKPHAAWPKPRRSKEAVLAAMRARLEQLPGNAYEYTQPIEMRFNELIAGVRSDLAVKVFGDDLDVMREHGAKIAELLRTIPGAADVKTEQVTGLPFLTIELDRAAVARFGLDVASVQGVVRTALAGSEAGEIFEGDRRFEVVVRLPESVRTDLRTLEMLPVPMVAAAASSGATALPAVHTGARTEFVPLGALAKISLGEGPNQVSRENGKRRVVVQANVSGRDIGSFVAEAQRHIEREVELPAGYWLVWGGQFENLIAARSRLLLVVPLALASIFLLLCLAFRSITDAALVFSGVPFALTGGVLALAARGLPFSITAAVGFIALSGVAVLNGVVMLSFIRGLRQEGVTLGDAIVEGSVSRLRPVLMTALVASLGFVPMAIATGTGAEVQRPLATVVVGGIVSSTLLTLILLPVLYWLANRGRE
jgi:cobalt-zinc-cadmium resistance protein CzcA